MTDNLQSPFSLALVEGFSIKIVSLIRRTISSIYSTPTAMASSSTATPVLPGTATPVLPGTKHKVIGLVSGGKDSCFNLMHTVANGHEIVALATLTPPANIGEQGSTTRQGFR